MNNASHILREEHEVILRALNVLEAMAARLCADKIVDPGDIHDMIRFIGLYADDNHNKKEETLCYPALKRATQPVHNGAIKQLADEHRLALRYCRDMRAASENNNLKKNIVVAAATSYIELMRRHIEKENGWMFPLGDRTIPRAEQAAVASALLSYEAPQTDHRTLRILYDMLTAFESKYLIDPM